MSEQISPSNNSPEKIVEMKAGYERLKSARDALFSKLNNSNQDTTNFSFALHDQGRVLFKKYSDEAYGYVLFHLLIGSSISDSFWAIATGYDFLGEDSIEAFLLKKISEYETKV